MFKNIISYLMNNVLADSLVIFILIRRLNAEYSAIRSVRPAYIAMDFISLLGIDTSMTFWKNFGIIITRAEDDIIISITRIIFFLYGATY